MLEQLERYAAHGLAMQVVEELLAYWKLEDADDSLEELEEVLIVSSATLESQQCDQIDPPLRMGSF